MFEILVFEKRKKLTLRINKQRLLAMVMIRAVAEHTFPRKILRRTSTPLYDRYGKNGLSFLLFHNLCAYRAGCGANAYCEVGFDKTTGEERPVCLCNPGYVGKERLNRVVTKLPFFHFRENSKFRLFRSSIFIFAKQTFSVFALL
jgi:hypothetical protein